MNRSRIGRVVSLTIAVVLFGLVGSGVALSARANNPLDQVLTKLDAIIGMLVPSAGTVTLVSPPVIVADSEGIVCLLTNVGTENIEILQRIILIDGTVLSEVPLSVASGHSDGVSQPGGGIRRCEFTFEGVATSVRAIAQVINGDGVAALVEAR